MSIEDEIADRVGRKMLFPLMPKAPGATPRRAMFIEERIWLVLESPEGDDEWEERVGNLRADLELFVTEEQIDPKYLFLLYPPSDAVWEIRSIREDPSIRVLGLFALEDVWIATNAALREYLGGWQSREWKEVKRTARANWRVLFPGGYNAVVTTDIHEVVTGALDGRYFRE